MSLTTNLCCENYPHTIYEENEGENNPSIFLKLENISNTQKGIETNIKLGVCPSPSSKKKKTQTFSIFGFFF